MWMWSTGINRNIVECKVKDVVEALETPERINRNIVECKDYTKIEITECYESY